MNDKHSHSEWINTMMEYDGGIIVSDVDEYLCILDSL